MNPPELIFVCWGNICRSPMAERVACGHAERLGLQLEISSAGVSSEEAGNPMDSRAAAVLTRAGYTAGGHRAHKITAEEIRRAALVVGMEQLHLDVMRRMVPQAENLRLLTDFDPAAVPGTGVPDPWYGPSSGFNATLEAIEAAMPTLLEHIGELV